ncbi:MAG: hypothetical protein WC628_00715 [Candidatus Omnitrophota bacterium]
MLNKFFQNKTKAAIILLWLLGAMICFDFVSAELPQEIFFQARLTEKNRGVPTGSRRIKFRLYTSLSGGTVVWNEAQSLTPDSSGIISCYMASVNSFPADLNFNATYYLSLEVDNDGEMSPRLKLVPALGALNARRLAGLNYLQFLRSDTASTMSGALTISNYLAQTYSGTDTGAFSINYNPASGSYNALDLIYGSGGGKGVALKITQSGIGDIIQVYDANSAAFVIKNGGNVGIGTSLPTQKLEVSGTVKATAFSGDGSGLSGISGLISGLSAGRIVKAGSAASLADSAIIESAGGNIGIGVSSPTAKLHVSGGFIATGNVGIGTLSPGQLLDVAGGAIRTDNQLISTADEGTAPLVVSSATLVSNLNADKLDGFDSSSFISSSVISSGSANYLAKYTAADTIGASALIYDNGTNVGIGTASPTAAKLQVNGAVSASAFLIGQATVSVDTSQAYLNSGLATGLLKITSGSGALSVVTDNSSDWDAAYTNRITSVSATAPLVLSLAGNALSGSITQAGIAQDGYLSSGDWNIFNAKQDALVFSTGLTNSAGAITVGLSTGISGGQSVIGGIGSGDNLTLSSSSHATKGKIIFGSASAYDQANDRLGMGTAAPSAKVDIIAAGTGAGMALRLRDSSGADKIIIFDNGNIGIGTGNPKRKLDVVGDIRFSGCIRHEGVGDLAEMMPYSTFVAQAEKPKAKEKRPWYNFFPKKKKAQINPADKDEQSRNLLGAPEAGDVVVIDKDGGIRRCFKAYATNAAGIISTNPVQLLRDNIDNAAPVALSGIVPCKVTNENGAIEPGDLLVCSSLPGHAMAAGANPPVGSIVGKAIGKLKQQQKTGLIEILVALK